MHREPDQDTLRAAATGGLVTTIAERVRGLTGRPRYVLALATGLASVLAMPPFHLWPVLLVTLPLLLWLIDGAAERSGALHATSTPFRVARAQALGAGLMGWCFGYAFHVAGLYWLREAFLVTGGGLALLWPLGVFGLPAYLAVYHGLAAAIAVTLAPAGPRRVAALAVGFGVSEWLRGHAFTGFPWNVLGEALTYPLVLMQSAAVLGIYGLTIVTVATLAAPGVILATPRFRRRGLAALACLAAPLIAMASYGTLRLAQPVPADVAGVRLRLVQPSIDQRDKWKAEKQPEFIARQIALSRRDPQGRQDDLAGITHVIWPEAAMPYLPLHRPEVLEAIDEALPPGVHLLAGILRLERGETREADKVFNSLVVFDDRARPITVYDKTHLVPFGEYLPFPSFLEGIGLSSLTRQRGGFAIGPTPRPLLHIPGLIAAGPLICYEAVFPGIAASSAGRPSVMINVTNDGWFGNSTGPRQHLYQARLRSVEEGLPMIRVANNGITAVFDAYGRERARLDLDVAGVIDTPLPQSIEQPLYARHGDLLFTIMVSIISFLLLVVRHAIIRP